MATRVVNPPVLVVVPACPTRRLAARASAAGHASEVAPTRALVVTSEAAVLAFVATLANANQWKKMLTVVVFVLHRPVRRARLKRRYQTIVQPRLHRQKASQQAPAKALLRPRRWSQVFLPSSFLLSNRRFRRHDCNR